MKRVYFDDLPIDNVNLNSVVNRLKNLAKKNEKNIKTAACLNVNNINWSYKNKTYRQFIKQSDLVIPDGWGVVWAGKILGYKLKERTTTADYFEKFCQILIKNNFSCYFLGSRPQVIKKAVKNLKNKLPNLKICGYHAGFFNKQQEKEIIKEINIKKPHFLLLGMGTPKQEIWLYKNKHQLKAKVGWGIGAMFDYLAGVKKRCPFWLGKLGLEWLFRFCCEPRRLWKRYTISNISFIFKVFKIKINNIFKIKD